MRSWEREEEDKLLGAQVNMLSQFAQTSPVVRKRVKLTLTKTQKEKGKKTKNVQETLYLPVHMLHGFRSARLLKRTADDISPRSEVEEMNDYLKSEIEKFARERKPHSCEETHDLETQGIGKNRGKLRRKVREATSPLEKFLEDYGNRRLLSQVAVEKRRKATEKKMNAIQPSLDVQRIARKYLRDRKQPQSKPISPRVQTSQPDSAAFSGLAESDESIVVDRLLTTEARAAHQDLHSALRIATLVNHKNHRDRVHK